MSSLKDGNNVNFKVFVKVQKGFSLLSGLFSLLFPFYILYQHGLSTLPVYDRQANVIGHANYFLLSLAMSFAGLLLSFLAYWAANEVEKGSDD